jgi:hypothetical protein
MSASDEVGLPVESYRRLRAPAGASQRARDAFASRRRAASPALLRLALGTAAVVMLVLVLRSPEAPQAPPASMPRAPQLTDLRLPERPALPPLKLTRPAGDLSVPRLSRINLTRLKTTETRS